MLLLGIESEGRNLLDYGEQDETNEVLFGVDQFTLATVFR